MLSLDRARHYKDAVYNTHNTFQNHKGRESNTTQSPNQAVLQEHNEASMINTPWKRRT